MKHFDAVEIVLDKKRNLLFNHAALRMAETEINKLRFADPSNHTSIDFLMVDTVGRLANSQGMMPMDLLMVMLWAGLLHEDPKLTVDKTAELLDAAELTRSEIGGLVWGAYWKVSEKNFKKADEGEQKKTNDQDQPLGSNSSPLQ